MFDPNMMNAMGEMMKNPEMLKQMEEMMKNPDIMSNAMKMMNDPSMANLFGGEMPNMNADNESNNDNDKNCCDNGDCGEECETKFSKNDKVKLVNLKSESYNGQECVVRGYDTSTNRYSVFVISMDKVISVKEENIENDGEVLVEVN
jgi:hypothetical protein